VSPFWSLLRGIRAAVTLRRKVSGPLRPSWDPTFEALAEFFHQGSRRITRLPLEAQRRTTTSVLLGLPSSPLYQETRFEKLEVAGTPAEWFRREDAAQGPVILYLHGGGYGLGNIETHRDLIARICRASRGSAIALDYRLAPEHKFPAQLEDALCAFQWLLDEHIDPARIVIAGDSAGGGLAMSTLLKLRDVGHPMPAAGVLLSPWIDLEQTGATLDVNERYDYISRRALDQYARRFIDPTQLKNPLANALYADLSGLPPLLIQAGSAEVLLDDALRLADRAKADGVDVTLRIWEDMIHVWHLFAFMAPQGVAAIEEIGVFIREHVHGV
jgi:monoterpene epsilon-lactone hydrolase